MRTTFPFVAEDMLAEHIVIFHRVRLLMNALVGLQPFMLSCHAVCDALAQYEINVMWKIGQFHIGYDHSWLVSKDGRVLIDPYPWAVASGPILMLNDRRTPWPKLYTGHDGVILPKDHHQQVQYIMLLWVNVGYQPQENLTPQEA